MWFTSLFGALRLASSGAQAEGVRRKASKRSPYGKRSRVLTVESLEHRLCLSIDLLVASRDTATVQDYDGTTGMFLGAFILDGYGGLKVPTGMAFGAEGNFYVAGFEGNDVLRYDWPTGVFLGEFVPAGSGGLTNPHAMAFGPDGNLYVSSNGNDSIRRYDGITGAPLPAPGQTGAIFVPPGSGSLSAPSGLVFGPDDNLYVNSDFTSSVMRYDGVTGASLPSPGQTGAFFVPTGSGGLNDPKMGLTFGADGNLYVGNWGGSSVLRYVGADGTPLPAPGQTGATFVPSGSGGLNSTHGVAFGPDGNLYACSEFSHSVLRYDGTTGGFIDAFVPTASGQLNRPINLIFRDTGAGGATGRFGTHVRSGSAPSTEPLSLLAFATLSKPQSEAITSGIVSSAVDARPVKVATSQHPVPEIASAWSSASRSTARAAVDGIVTVLASEDSPGAALGRFNGLDFDVLALNLLGWK